MSDRLVAVAARARWRRGLALWAPPALYALAIFWCSTLSAPPAPPQQFSDKHVHMLEFAGLAVLVARALAGRRWSGVTSARCALAVAVTVAYGATDEWHQAFVPGRHADLWDLAADAAGAVAAIAALAALAAWHRRRLRPDGTIERAAEGSLHTP